MSVKREVKYSRNYGASLALARFRTLLFKIVPLLLCLGNKDFGISAQLRRVCAMWPYKKPAFLQYDWRK